MIITSFDNATVKAVAKLRNKKYRDEQNKYVIEGYRSVKDSLPYVNQPLLIFSESAFSQLGDEFDRVVKSPAASQTPLAAEDVKLSSPRKVKATGGVVVDGEEGCVTKFAHCCNPLPGDQIIGFITRGYGVSIHNLNDHTSSNGGASRNLFITIVNLAVLSTIEL